MAGDANSRTSTTLLKRLRDSPRDPEAWEQFVRKYRPMILDWCRAWGVQAADAEDVAQAVLSKLLDLLPGFEYDPTRRFRAWLRTVTQRVSIDRASSRRTDATGSPGVRESLENLEARVDLERRLAEAFDLELLDLALERVRGRVAESTWEAFRLTAVEGLSGADAARRLGIPVSQVFVAKHRVRKLLRQVVGEPTADPDETIDRPTTGPVG
jgi:RNA polymerase sigma factor (sigma-70 family)